MTTEQSSINYNIGDLIYYKNVTAIGIVIFINTDFVYVSFPDRKEKEQVYSFNTMINDNLIVKLSNKYAFHEYEVNNLIYRKNLLSDRIKDGRIKYYKLKNENT